MTTILSDIRQKLYNKITLSWMMLLFLFFACNEQDYSVFDIEERDGDLTIFKNGKPVLVYNIETDLPDSLNAHYTRSGYIHPLYSPSGKTLTDGFPVGHAHQHGIFYAFVKTFYNGDFTDFWNQQKETGTVRHLRLKEKYVSAEKAGFKATLEHLSLKHGVILEEEIVVEVLEIGAGWGIDWSSKITNIAKDTLKIDEYLYGGLGIRGSKVWNDADSVHFQEEAQYLSSEGKDRLNGNHTSAEWATLYGSIDGADAGIAVISHPDNFRHPQKVRIHPKMPYFCFAPMVDGAFILPPGAFIDSKYLIIPFDGLPDIRLLDEQFYEFKESGQY